MFLCYCDESGYCGKRNNPDQPVMVLAGVLPNAYNYHRSDAEFRQVFEIINGEVPLDEIKGSQIYRGRGSWRDIDPSIRDQVIEFYIHWICSRPHKLLVSAIDNSRYFRFIEENPESPYAQFFPYPYLFSGFHIAMTIQKLNKNQKKNKGRTILIFDEQHEFSDDLTDLLFDPPEFTDEFVPFDPDEDENRLSQIIDTAFFVKSHHSSMAQVSDIVSYLVCLYLQLEYYGLEESYEGELDKIRAWVSQIEGRYAPLSTQYPKTSRPFLDFINSIKADGIRE